MRNIKIVISLLVLLFAPSMFPLVQAAPTAAVPVVCTANYPLKYIASRIAGDLARVEYLVPAGSDPASWTPDEATLLRFLEADLILLNGAGYEKWLTTASLPINRLIDTTQSVSSQYIYSGEVVTHTHGPAGEHSHESLASTTWLDLTLAAGQARSVAAALIDRIPEHQETLAQNLEALVKELEQLDHELTAIAEASAHPALLTSHPVYQYFGRRYGFELSTVHWEPEDLPPVSEWQQLEVIREQHFVKWMLWEAEPLPEVRAELTRLGIEPVVFRTLEIAPDQGDFMSVMRDNIAALKRIVE